MSISVHLSVYFLGILLPQWSSSYFWRRILQSTAYGREERVRINLHDKVLRAKKEKDENLNVHYVDFSHYLYFQYCASYLQELGKRGLISSHSKLSLAKSDRVSCPTIQDENRVPCILMLFIQPLLNKLSKILQHELDCFSFDISSTVTIKMFIVSKINVYIIWTFLMFGTILQSITGRLFFPNMIIMISLIPCALFSLWLCHSCIKTWNICILSRIWMPQPIAWCESEAV